jgi:hypothetical protein
LFKDSALFLRREFAELLDNFCRTHVFKFSG